MTMLAAVVMQDCGVIKQVTKFCLNMKYLPSVTNEACQYILLIDSQGQMRKGVSTSQFWSLLI